MRSSIFCLSNYVTHIMNYTKKITTRPRSCKIMYKACNESRVRCFRDLCGARAHSYTRRPARTAVLLISFAGERKRAQMRKTRREASERTSRRRRRCEQAHATDSRPANALVVLAHSLTVHVTVPWPTAVFHLTLRRTRLARRQTFNSLPFARSVSSWRARTSECATREMNRERRETSRVSLSCWQSELVCWCTNGNGANFTIHFSVTATCCNTKNNSPARLLHMNACDIFSSLSIK